MTKKTVGRVLPVLCSLIFWKNGVSCSTFVLRITPSHYNTSHEGSDLEKNVFTLAYTIKKSSNTMTNLTNSAKIKGKPCTNVIDLPKNNSPWHIQNQHKIRVSGIWSLSLLFKTCSRTQLLVTFILNQTFFYILLRQNWNVLHFF